MTKNFMTETKKRIYLPKLIVDQNGFVCYQCDELNEIFQGNADVETVRERFAAKNHTSKHDERVKLIQKLNPLKSNGTNLHHHLMEHLKKVNGYD